jgi:hypothetical protein
LKRGPECKGQRVSCPPTCDAARCSSLLNPANRKSGALPRATPLDFEVVIREGSGETRHYVTMSREMCERLTAGKHTPERCLEAAFRFLLDREPKESILGCFDATVISRYFPEF